VSPTRRPRILRRSRPWYSKCTTPLKRSIIARPDGPPLNLLDLIASVLGADVSFTSANGTPPSTLQKTWIGSVKRPKTTNTDDDWDALAHKALKAARQMPKGPERIEALKQAGRLRMAADRKQIQFTPLGRPPKGMNAKGTISVAR